MRQNSNFSPGPAFRQNQGVRASDGLGDVHVGKRSHSSEPANSDMSQLLAQVMDAGTQPSAARPKVQVIGPILGHCPCDVCRNCEPAAGGEGLGQRLGPEAWAKGLGHP
jgi:hypothetical protein